ncbi:MAG: double zinc ribbon domain-containing protein [Thermodesulfobacteriota bacterium]
MIDAEIVQKDNFRILKSLLDLFFPPSCPICEEGRNDGICPSCMAGVRLIRSPLCSLCGLPFSSPVSLDHLCGDCMKHRKAFSVARSAGTYEGKLLEAIHLLKYKGKTAIARPLGALLAHVIDGRSYDIITPVPLHRKRLRERGFNQSLLLARGVAKRLKVPVDYLNLKRIRATTPQINLSGNERRVNVRKAFEVGNGVVFSGKRVLLIDDVYTTGATVSECSKALEKAGAREIGVLTLARVVNL